MHTPVTKKNILSNILKQMLKIIKPHYRRILDDWQQWIMFDIIIIKREGGLAKSCCINLNCATCYQASVGEDRNSITLARTCERSPLNAHLDFEYWVSVLSSWRLIASSVQYNRLLSIRSSQMNPSDVAGPAFCMYRSQSEVWDWLKSGAIYNFLKS